MNFLKHIFSVLTICIVGTLLITSCEEDDGVPLESPNGDPEISYIRVTDPAASDSLLVRGTLGSGLAIIGRNLGATQEIWFNDKQAVLTPSWVTNEAILVSIPSVAPSVITNKMYLVDASGDTLAHDFEVAIPEPEVHRAVNEWPQAGENLVINGDYFFDPTVTFTGGVLGEVVSFTQTQLEIAIPDGAESGPVTVTTNFGEVESGFWFRDNRNIIGAFEGTEDAHFEGWWHGKDYIVSSDPPIEPINGQFIKVDQEMGEWGWFEMWVGNGGTILEETSNIPADAFENSDNYSLKFEINTLAPLTGAHLRMYMGPDMPSQRDETYYLWEPELDTEGFWQTISIPFAPFRAANGDFGYDPNGYHVSFHFNGPDPVHALFGLDNIRVVQN